MTEKRLGNMPRFYFRKIGLNYWTREITGCRRHRISLLLAGMRNAGGFVLGRSRRIRFRERNFISSAFILTISVRWHVMSLL